MNTLATALTPEEETAAASPPLTPEERVEFIERARSRIGDLRRLQAAGLINKTGDFFPSVHYPPITMYPPVTEEEFFRTYTPPADGFFDVYAHIPFCKQHCVFCHYPVKLGPQMVEKDRYLRAFEREMDIYKSRLGFEKIKVRSILVGGGTPTYLTLDQMRRFLDMFTSRLDLSACRQFNYDVDPMTLIGEEGIARLKMMQEYGVDRLTIGVQSLDDAILKRMGRHHNAASAIESIRITKELGFTVNIELIFGYPTQTIDNWIDVMERAVTLGCDEIQLYRLKVEAYGDFQGSIKKYVAIKPEDCPSVEETITMKQVAIDILARHGYHENLRRVYSRKRGDYSVYAHNQCCLLFDQIGLGLTAFSSLRDRFALNTQSFDEYYSLIGRGKLPINRGLVRDESEQKCWAVVLPIKNRDVRKAYYKKLTGQALEDVFGDKMMALVQHGLAIDDGKAFKLTATGAFFADEVAQQFQNPVYTPYPREFYAEGILNPYNQ